MKKIGTPLIVISLCVLIIVVLFIPGIKTSDKKLPEKSSLNSDAPTLANFDTLEIKAAAALSPELKKEWKDLYKQLLEAKQDSEKLKCYYTLNLLWNTIKQYGLSGKYFFMYSEMDPSYKNWIFTAQSFYAGTQLANTREEVLLYAMKGEKAARQAMALDIKSNEAKVLLAELLIAQDKKSEGMPEYIPLLLQVLQKDSNNVEAIYNLGMQAIKSGQLDKAKARFEKLTALEPKVAGYYGELAEIYTRMGNANEALATYEKCLSLIKDPIRAQEIKNKIKEIKH